MIAYASWAANSSATAREKTLVDNALNRGIQRALQEQKRVAWLDETYQKLSGGTFDTEFLETEFGIILTETYGHDMVLILDPEDRVVFAYADGERQESAFFERHREVLTPIIAEARNRTTDRAHRQSVFLGNSQGDDPTIQAPIDIAGWSGRMRSIDGLAAFVTVLTILPNINMDLLSGPPHLLVSINVLDDDYMAELGRGLLLADLNFSAKPTDGGSVVSVPLKTEDGSAIGYLSWTTERPGRPLTTVVLPLVILGVIGVALQAYMMLRWLQRTSRDLAQQEKTSGYAARHDDLSGLPNRSHFDEHLREIHGRIKPDGTGQHAIVAYVDVDRFKDVNDTLGHSAGDQLIVEVGKRLRNHVRSGDFIARYGGDEFAILWLSADPRAPTILAERIARALIGSIDTTVSQ